MKKSCTLYCFVTATLLLNVLLDIPANAREKIILRTEQRERELRQVAITVEVAGELKLNPDGKKVSRRPLQVSAKLNYHEQIPGEKNGDQSATILRHYESAEAKITVGGVASQAKLSDDRRLISLENTYGSPLLFSPLGPLTRDELELLDISGGSHILAQLLPQRELQINESWPVDERTLSQLLLIDAITESKVTATLKSTTNTNATIEIDGKVTGIASGVTSEVELKAKVTVDTTRKTITWFAAAIRENREIGHAEPGYEATTQIRMQLTPLKNSPHLATSAIADIATNMTPGADLLRYAAVKSNFQILLDRRWRILADRHDVTILRHIDRGDLIGQCNVSILPELAAGKHTPLEELQEDIRKSLEKNSPQFIEATQSMSDEGLRVLRVVVMGEASELSVQWIYYLISNEKGERASLVFTLESNLVERFAEADRAIVSSFEFRHTAPTLAPALTAPAQPTAVAPSTRQTERK